MLDLLYIYYLEALLWPILELIQSKLPVLQTLDRLKLKKSDPPQQTTVSAPCTRSNPKARDVLSGISAATSTWRKASRMTKMSSPRCIFHLIYSFHSEQDMTCSAARSFGGERDLLDIAQLTHTGNMCFRKA